MDRPVRRSTRIRTLVAAVILAAAVLPLASPPAVAEGDARVVTLSKPRNLRQLGGLPAAGGVVKQGAVYRSAHLHHVPKVDFPVLQGLRLHTIIDLRTSVECLVQGKDAKKLVRSVGHRISLPLLNGFHPDAAYYHDMLKNYGNRRNMVKFFALLAEPSSYPVLYHCAFGKDRTGVMTALLLMALGTPRSSITTDYLASPGVREEWLKAVYQDVDAAGGIEPFLRQVGVTPEVLAAVRSNLVVPSPAR